MAEVIFKNDAFHVRTEIWDNERPKGAPSRIWDKVGKCWIIPGDRPNAMYVRDTFNDREISQCAKEEIERLDRRPKKLTFPVWRHDFGDYPPMFHQIRGLDDAYSNPGHALFFEMRLGKTYTSLHLALRRWCEADIEQLLVICPTPIKHVWEQEVGKFLDHVPTSVFVLEAGQHKSCEQWSDSRSTILSGVFCILVIGVEALSQGKAFETAKHFCENGKTMVVIDESSRIKNHKSSRTKRCIDLGGMCDYRLILTGTPTTQGLQDLYPQMEFLDKSILGQKSFYTFRNRYMIMGGFEGRQVMGYKNAHQLMQLIEPYSTMVKMKDVYDLKELPPEQRKIDPSPEQRKAFQELKQILRTEWEGEELEITTVLERMTRFQQINGGFFPAKKLDQHGDAYWEPRELKKNPKLEELEAMLPEFGDEKVIIWARFVPEILAIKNMLLRNHRRCVTFYGATPPEEREWNIDKFQNGDVQFFVGNQAVGGMGIKLSAADICIYYSNTFSYEDRKQSMARTLEVGKPRPTQYIDLVLNTYIDELIMSAQEKKGGIARFVENNIKQLREEMM